MSDDEKTLIGMQASVGLIDDFSGVEERLMAQMGVHKKKYQLYAKNGHPHFETNDIVAFCKEIENRYGIKDGDIKTAARNLPRSIRRQYQNNIEAAKQEATRRFKDAIKNPQAGAFIVSVDEWDAIEAGLQKEFKILLQSNYVTRQMFRKSNKLDTTLTVNLSPTDKEKEQKK
jgi:hypothetical protein